MEEVGAGSCRTCSPFTGIWLYHDNDNKEVQFEYFRGSMRGVYILFHSSTSISFLSPVPHSVAKCSFIIIFEINYCEIFNIFFQIILAMLGP